VNYFGCGSGRGRSMIGTSDTLSLPVFVDGSVAGLVEVFCE